MTKVQNVLFVLNAAEGGATEGVLELLRGLKGGSFRCFVVLPPLPEGRRANQIRAAAEDVIVVPMGWWNRKQTLPWWYRPLNWVRVNARTGVHVRSVRELVRLIHDLDIDLVYTSTTLIMDGALAARRTGRPHVWHIKEWVGRRGLFRFPLPDRWLARFVIGGPTDRVVAMSHFVAEPFEAYRRGSTLVIYDGVDLNRFANQVGPSDFRATLGLSPDDVLVATVSSLRAPSKRHDLFIDAAALVAASEPRVQFVIFGSLPARSRNPANNGSWNRYVALCDRLAKEGLVDRIQIGAFQQDIPQMMEAIDVLVHTSESEGFGRVAIEAMAASRPVVGPAGGGIAESVVDGETGFLVRPGDAPEFADAILELVQDPDLRTAQGKAGRSRAEGIFSVSSHVRKMESLFEEMLA